MNLDGFLDNCFLIFQEHKVLLTGTPLQNTVEELFSLLHFLEPGRFPSETTFMQEFGDLKTEEQVICSRTLTSLFTYCEFNHFAISELYYLLLQVIPVFLLRSPELIYPFFFLFCFFWFLHLWPKVSLPYHFVSLSTGHAETCFMFLFEHQ